jgi:hypothetical protein
MFGFFFFKKKINSIDIYWYLQFFLFIIFLKKILSQEVKSSKHLFQIYFASEFAQ